MTYQNSPQMLHTYTARLADASLSTHALPSGRPSLPTPPHARKFAPFAAPLSHEPPPPLSKRAGAPLLLAERILPCSIFSPADFFALFLVRETFLDILQKFIISNHWLRQK